ncbi:hypothetical protein GH714_007618 [Hevea brasiliensis]|uniref:PPM-type phosphatase domain-containing protein n=1 Tax=Hevea brasiliensis TaxID=3981 RepID=A0A6A6MCT6_HEVBR|nr:hypothetical protein GH714_007618 [Hevea brasiliensis]
MCVNGKSNVWSQSSPLCLMQVSRSIGDVYMKHVQYNQEPINGKFRLPEPMNMPILSAKPTIISHPLQPNDSFLIFASDGLWEHLSNEKAVDIVHSHPHAGSAKRLVKAALREAARKREMKYSDLRRIDKKVRRHFHDDITVIVLFLNHDLLSRGTVQDPPLSIRSSFPGFIGMWCSLDLMEMVAIGWAAGTDRSREGAVESYGSCWDGERGELHHGYMPYVEAAVVEPVFHKLYSYIFDMENMRYTAAENDRPVPNAIFIVNFDKKYRNRFDRLMYRKINPLTNEEIGKQEGNYYRYRYNGGGATQVWLSSDRFVVIDLSAGTCTYGKIETQEGSVSSRTLPWIRNMMFPRGVAAISDHVSHDIFVGQLAALIATTVEHVIAPDIRFETVDLATRLLIPIIVLQNHNRYNIMEKGHNYSINIEEIESEVKKMVHDGPEVVIVGGSHALHSHEKLAIAVSKAMQGHSLQETKKDGRFHVHTKTYLDGTALKEVLIFTEVYYQNEVDLGFPLPLMVIKSTLAIHSMLHRQCPNNLV